MKKILLLFTMLSLPALSVGYVAQSVEKIKTEDNIGEKVIVKGTVSTTIQLGDFSGYILEDSHGTNIGVSSNKSPEKGERVRVRGTLMKDSVFGYYIKE